MIRAAVGLSTHWNTARAALEAGAQAAREIGGGPADWCLAFATQEHAAHLTTLQETIAGATGTPYVVGCSAAGVLTAEREIEDGPALGVLAVASDGLRGTPFLFRDTGDLGMTAGVRVGQRLASSRASGDLLVVCPDALHVRPDRLLHALDAVLGAVPVVGGAASSHAPDDGTFQFCGAESDTAAVAGIRLGGSFRHAVGVTQGCRPIGRPLRVTRAHDGLLLELDGAPALETLGRIAPAGLLDDGDRVMRTLFVGLLPDRESPEAAAGEYLVRNIVAVDADAGMLAIGDHVEEGQYVVFAEREPAAARDDLLRMLERVSPRRTGLDYRFGLYFNCRARGTELYRREGVDTALIRAALPGVPLLGFFCNAEIGPLRGLNQLFTYTGVLALFAE